jgi:hypothetical protein
MEPVERSAINGDALDRWTSDRQCADGESNNAH